MYFNCDFNIKAQRHLPYQMFESCTLCLCQVMVDVTYIAMRVDNLIMCSKVSLLSSYVQVDADSTGGVSCQYLRYIAASPVLYDVDIDIKDSVTANQYDVYYVSIITEA